jgi:hemoglobin-like flavoprotein
MAYVRLRAEHRRLGEKYQAAVADSDRVAEAFKLAAMGMASMVVGLAWGVSCSVAAAGWWTPPRWWFEVAIPLELLFGAVVPVVFLTAAYRVATRQMSPDQWRRFLRTWAAMRGHPSVASVDMSTDAPLDVHLLRSSFDIILARAVDAKGESNLAWRIYDRFFGQYPDARRLFNKSLAVQERMLAEAFLAVIEHLEDADWLTVVLGSLGKQHHAWHVTPKMYGWVKASILWVFRDVMGTDWTDEMENQWNAALSAVNNLMLAGYPPNGLKPDVIVETKAVTS